MDKGEFKKLKKWFLNNIHLFAMFVLFAWCFMYAFDRVLPEQFWLKMMIVCLWGLTFVYNLLKESTRGVEE